MRAFLTFVTEYFEFSELQLGETNRTLFLFTCSTTSLYTMATPVKEGCEISTEF